MKKPKIVIFALIAIVFATPLFSQTIINPGFEAGVGDSTFAVGWHTNQAETKASLELTADGQNQVTKISPSDNWTKSIRQEFDLNIEQFIKYRLSAKMKTEDMTGERSKAYLFASLYDDQDFQVNYANNRDQNLKNIPEWTDFAIEFVAPPETTRLRIGGALVGKDSGTVWFDDFELALLPFEPDDIQLSEAARNYLQEVREVMQEKALHKEKLNFEHIHQLMQIEASGAKTVEDTYSAISKGLRLLNDHHSSFLSADRIKEILGVDTVDIEKLKEDPLSHIEPEKLDSLKAAIDYSSGRIIHSKTGYIRVPSFTSLYYEGQFLFADSLQQLIKSLDQPDLRGWIVDLRGNPGGANAPMITGIGPLLDDKNTYSYVDSQGQPVSEYHYVEGGYKIAGSEEEDTLIHFVKTSYQTQKLNLPVAVLLNDQTASAAEAVTAAFLGQANVKTFGSSTAGATTGNEAIFLNDGALLNITTSYLADRNKTIYKQGIDPDIEVEFNRKVGEDLESDPVVLKAVEWMKEYN
ncbi:MAG: S41 family peptidase [Bacteroidota bacterium]